MSAFTCPHCGGPIAYSPGADAMTCAYCDSTISLDDYRAHLNTRHRLLLNQLSCPQCGAQLLTTNTTAATFCSYCGSSVALEARLVEADQPESIIPFKIGAKRARNIYQTKIHETLLAPDWMEDADTLSHFRGIYMPFHVFSYGWQGKWEGEASETSVRTINGTKYDVTRTYDTGAHVNVDYRYIPQDAAAAFPDAMSRAVCPFKESGERPFDLTYFASYYADRGDVDASLYEQKYADLVRADVLSRPSLKCGKVNVDAATATQGMELQPKAKRSMFPVWFLSTRKRDKVNYACVNGATGELVCDIPIDFKKYLKAAVIVAGIFSVTLNLFLTLKPNNMLVVAAVLALITFIVANGLLNDTYRREKRLDDPGYTGESSERVVTRGVAGRIFGALGKIVLATLGVVGLLLLLVAVDISSETAGSIVGIAFLAWVVYFIVAVVQVGSKKHAARVKQPRAPMLYKMLVLIKPVLALVAAALVIMLFPEVDEACYIAAMGAICMIIWTAFDVVRTQNRFTMRDLPLFNEKRGGEA